MPVALSSSSADWAGLQSTLTTWPAPCSSRLRALQPPLVSVSTVSSFLIFSTYSKAQHSSDKILLLYSIQQEGLQMLSFLPASHNR